MEITNIDIDPTNLGLIDKYKLWKAKRKLFKMLRKVIDENGTLGVFISITGEAPSPIISKINIPFEAINIHVNLKRNEIGKALNLLERI